MNREWKCLFLIITVFIAACIETDIYLPAFPDMMIAFSASEGAIQSLLTWNFIGICLAGPFYGPLSDAFGRKRPLMIALLLFFLGSVMTVFAKDLDQMLWGRILQGIGSGGCFTLGTAIIFDCFQKQRAIEAVNSLNMIIPVIMSIAPMLGGYLNYNFGFRSNFLAIGIFVLISLIVCFFSLEESLAVEKRQPFKLKSIARDFGQVFRNLAFWQLTLVMSLSFAGYIAFLSGTSVLFVVEFGMSKALFPFFQAAILGGWVFGSLRLKKAVNKWGIPAVKKIGSIICVIGGVVLALTALVAPENAYLLTLGMTIYAFGANWIIGLYFPEGMEILPHIKGITASLLTSARLLIASIFVAFASYLYNATAYPLVAIVIGSLIIMMLIIVRYERQKRLAQNV